MTLQTEVKYEVVRERINIAGTSIKKNKKVYSFPPSLISFQV